MGRPKGSSNKPKGDNVEKQIVATTDMGLDESQMIAGKIVAMPARPKSVIRDMSDRYGMEPDAFEAALRATVVPKDCAPAQFAAFLLVAKEYGLNPLTKEIYAFPSRGGGIVPIVSVDGWVNLINSQGQCDGFSFEMEHEGDRLISCTCKMFRKDRTHPVVVTEYYSECVRSTDPWKMKHRMLRHKALIQAGRYAFGFSGIYDEDEGAKIAEIDPNKDAGPPRSVAPETQSVAPGTQPRAISPPPEAAQEDVETARDATPPRRPEPSQAATAAPPRTPPKADPISTGPQRTAPKAADKPPEPFKIPGAGETYESWAAKYVDMIKTSPDTATLMKWGDVNAEPLTKLKKGNPSVSGQVDTAIKRTMEALNAEKEERAKQTAAKQATKAELAAPLAGDMDAPNEMDDGPGATYSDPDVPQNPEDILAIIEQELAAVEDADQLQNTWDRVCEPLMTKLDFPPDQDAAQAIFQRHEKRLGAD